MIEPISITPDWPAPNNVRLVSTTRVGGFSQTPYNSFNLALHTNDNLVAVEKNRTKLREYFKLPSEPVWLNQVHGNQLVSLNNEVGMTPIIINADASWTTHNNKVCAVLTADCLPVFITDVKGSVVALAHAGWKGLLAGVITKTVESLNVNRQDLLVWLGAAIGADAFVVGDEVRALFFEKNKDYLSAFEADKNRSWRCNLYQLARIELAGMGIEQIYGGELCTFSDEEQFFSYRRDGVNTGRQAHCLWLSAL